MLLYRLSTEEMANDLSGVTGIKVDNFWTNKGNPCIYAHGSRANCMMENRIYELLDEINPDMLMVEYEVPDGSLQVFDEEQLPEEWMNDRNPSVARDYGTLRLQAAETLVMAFPSRVMADGELVYIINPSHPLMKEVRITRVFKPMR
ncbi:hypothetical protein GFS24_27500 [Chitinophaga sp. SYP-B3965]|uniref:RES family NAD+ phosphorylase n=1 Tax=Chitinophaga sp. SYP-B3965 TaxID=2663120 RepID=UPI00129956A7|nr:RES family NAD+ phosphorylase [Chitinophaga sp. SYP-B3965]MRG48887.1 hypothetical protein [Chitinophaga sp. SYP-B3965]